MRSSFVLSAALILASVGLPEARAGVLLYDPSLGGLPASQPWLAYADNAFLPGTSVTQAEVPGVGTRLTSNLPGQGGYSKVNSLAGSPKNPGFPGLDRAIGFELVFDLLVTSESHSNPNRAGFSVIALADDGLGIELGFWTGEVWAQNTGFSHGEGAAFNT